MRNSQLSLVIPTALPNQWDWFWKQNAAHVKNTHCIVVASFERPVTLDSAVEWIVIPKPLGFAKTVNSGFVAAKTPFVATCNDDVILPQNWLNLVKTLVNNPSAGAVNPIVVDREGEIESAGITILAVGRAVPVTKVAANQPYRTEAVNGACVVFSEEFLSKTGGFDESFESYLEDIELSIRGRKLGYRLLVDPTVVVHHYRHQTSNTILGAQRKAWLDMRNWWKITLRHTSLTVWMRHGFGIMVERMRNASGYIKTLL